MRQNAIIRRLTKHSQHSQHNPQKVQRIMQSTTSSSSASTPPKQGLLLRREDVSLSMSGCGWLTPFHIGVVQAFKDHGLFYERTKVAGSSGGSLAGLIACSGLDQAEVRKYHLAFASHFISSRGIFKKNSSETMM